MTNKEKVDGINGLQPRTVHEVMVDYGAEVMACVQAGEFGKLAQLAEDATKEVIALIVDEDAELPENPNVGKFKYTYYRAQQDMLAVGWRKVVV